MPAVNRTRVNDALPRYGVIKNGDTTFVGQARKMEMLVRHRRWAKRSEPKVCIGRTQALSSHCPYQRIQSGYGASLIALEPLPVRSAMEYERDLNRGKRWHVTAILARIDDDDGPPLAARWRSENSKGTCEYRSQLSAVRG